jgi:hypothetical protein
MMQFMEKRAQKKATSNSLEKNSLRRNSITQSEPTAVYPEVHTINPSSSSGFSEALKPAKKPNFGHDFSQVPVQSKSSGVIQPKPIIHQLRHPLEQEENRTKEVEKGMPEPLKTRLEQLSGRDLSGVRVHYDSNKPSQLNALAYTQGNDVYIGPGQERHLPHEGWHIVQQMQGRVRPTGQANGVSINDDENLEHEADAMGAKALQTKSAAAPLDDSDLPPQRKISRAEKDRFEIQKKIKRKSTTSANQSVHTNLESVRGISHIAPAQLQASEETNSKNEQLAGEMDEAKRAEYQSLQSEPGGGEDQSASTSGSANIQNEEQPLSQLKSNDIAQLVGCTPANTALGNNALSFAERSRESWRSHVTYRARVNNQNDHLTISMYVFAKVYYGLWVSWEHLRFSATVDLTCQSVENKCEISANERGGSVWDLTDSPASGAIAVQTDSRAGGTQMGLTVRVGGAVGASSSVSAGVGSASVGVSFPDASISHKMSMGTYIYSCRD